jgi:uncharacterized damage-inducible protein DinB
MSMKPNIIYALNQSRQMIEGLVASMTSVKDWLYQAHPKANHGLWIVGHLGLADNMFLTRLDESAGNKPDGWDELFWFGSKVQPEAAKYPVPEEVVSYFRERREKLNEAISGLTDEFLESPTPQEGMFSEAPNMGSMLFFIAYHEGIHTGQFTVAHRGLGNDPMFQPSPESATSQGGTDTVE